MENDGLMSCHSPFWFSYIAVGKGIEKVKTPEDRTLRGFHCLWTYYRCI